MSLLWAPPLPLDQILHLLTRSSSEIQFFHKQDSLSLDRRYLLLAARLDFQGTAF